MDTVNSIELPPGIDFNSKLIILIIGSTGNVGRGVLDAFEHCTSFQNAINNGLLEIRAAFHNLKSKQLIEKYYPSIKSVELDIDQINVNNRSCDQSVQTAFTGVKCLFLQTGYFTKSIIQSKTIIDYAKSVNVEFILHGGVLTQDNTINKSFAFHILIEKYIENLGFKYCHLHPSVYMQVLIGYVGERAVNLTEKTNKIYQLTSDQVTMEQVTKLFSEEFQIELKYNYINAEDWADLTCDKILQNKQISNREKFSQCDYIHAIKQAFIRHNNNTFDEQWKIYLDLNYLLNYYQWKKSANTLQQFIKDNRDKFLE